jgi:hypothetical protein
MVLARTYCSWLMNGGNDASRPSTKASAELVVPIDADFHEECRQVGKPLVAQALQPAVSALLPTRCFDARRNPRAETSLGPAA